MADKPTEVPDWTPSGTDVVIPTAGEKSGGFKGGQRPPAQFINWFWELLTQWIVWLNAGILQRSSLTNRTPILQTTDRGARVRQYLDASGYWMGNARQLDYIFYPIDNTGILPSGDSCSPTGLIQTQEANTDALVRAGLLTGYPTAASPVLVLRLDSAATSEAVTACPETDASDHNIISDLDNVVAVCEMSVSTSSVGANNASIAAGLRETLIGTGPASNTRQHAVFHRDSGDTNWQCSVSKGDASGTSTDSGVAVTVDTFFHFRIEMHGANTPLGVDNSTSGVVRFFIDGALVHEDTSADVPNTESVGPWLGAEATGALAGDIDLECSRCKVAWNDTLDFDAPA